VPYWSHRPSSIGELPGHTPQQDAQVQLPGDE
jgi:hypothetical protein